MASTDYVLTSDDEFDDLPRTFRREREARERQAREARERDALGRVEPQMTSAAPRSAGAYGGAEYASVAYASDPVPAILKRFDVPFLRLAAFFIKAVLAAIPALILLGCVLWAAGNFLQSQFPWLVKMQIFIHFPQ